MEAWNAKQPSCVGHPVLGYRTGSLVGRGCGEAPVEPKQLASLRKALGNNPASRLIAAGGAHSLAVLSDGTVWAWGNNSNGQLGDGTLLDRTVPVQVQGLNDGVDVAAGASHSLAMYPNGTLWGWGLNAYGQIGDGGATQYAFRPTLSLLY
ncbi:hypothetical protein [Stigmatella erecta]|uniref:RCC1 domain-containing protein n=1 Tax=Stigmatella erecta TaxID=83460 RepID=UPI000B828A05